MTVELASVAELEAYRARLKLNQTRFDDALSFIANNMELELAGALLECRGIREEDYALVHPGGTLGRKLLKVEDLMHRGDELPLAGPERAENSQPAHPEGEGEDGQGPRPPASKGRIS